MENLKTRLSKYGNVITCEANDEQLTINMKLDKSTTYTVTDCIGIINDEAGKLYPNTKSCNFNNKEFNCTLLAVT